MNAVQDTSDKFNLGLACLRLRGISSTRRYWRIISRLDGAWYARHAVQEMVAGAQSSSSHASDVSRPCHVTTSKQRIWVIINRRKRKPWHARHASVYELAKVRRIRTCWKRPQRKRYARLDQWMQALSLVYAEAFDILFRTWSCTTLVVNSSVKPCARRGLT